MKTSASVPLPFMSAVNTLTMYLLSVKWTKHDKISEINWIDLLKKKHAVSVSYIWVCPWGPRCPVSLEQKGGLLLLYWASCYKQSSTSGEAWSHPSPPPCPRTSWRSGPCCRAQSWSQTTEAISVDNGHDARCGFTLPYLLQRANVVGSYSEHVGFGPLKRGAAPEKEEMFCVGQIMQTQNPM